MGFLFVKFALDAVQQKLLWNAVLINTAAFLIIKQAAGNTAVKNIFFIGNHLAQQIMDGYNTCKF